MKGVVFGNGLLCVAFSAAADVRIWGLGHLPVLFQAQIQKMVTVPPALSAIVAVRRPRPYHVDVGSSRPPMKPIGSLSAQSFDPALDELYECHGTRIRLSKTQRRNELWVVTSTRSQSTTEHVLWLLPSSAATFLWYLLAFHRRSRLFGLAG